MAAPGTKASIGYAGFGTWYDEHRTRVLDPALSVAMAALLAALDDALSDRDRTRIRRISGRVKSKRRAWRKLKRLLREGAITTVDDVPTAIRDLVGLRITCTNLRDIEMVQAALDALPLPGSSVMGLCFDPGSERDYVIEPKESGYRGWHVNLEVGIEVEGKAAPVTIELQVRTLLQDSWGELTHEDTYSKDGELPPLVEVLSKRMADLFATLDDIAEDLRSELDRLDQAAVAEPGSADPAALDLQSEQAADAASVLMARWSELDRPVDLAALAWQLQAEFGAEISDTWFGAASFKRFLLQSIPQADISTGRQAYLLPAQPEAAVEPEVVVEPEAITLTNDVPGGARALRRVDPGFPLLETKRWESLFSQLAEAWRRIGKLEPNARSLNRVTLSARDRSRSAGNTVSRRHLDYVAKSLLTAESDGHPLDAAAIATNFADLTLQRMTDLRIIGERDRKQRAQIQRWLGTDPEST
ncbi:MAG: ppGpp synthetase/RelA/SpoT-type nucleotidyltransferase [Acidimicrobiales bacterium]|jgi:ppGpp synthetase/RelA/SpoT-type nucleotidyltranferase